MFIEPNGAASSPEIPSGGASDSGASPVSKDLKSKKNPASLSPELELRASYFEVAPEAGAASEILLTQLRDRGGMVALSLDTGSTGNSTAYVGVNPDGGGEMIAVDCGLTRTKFREAMNELGLHHVGASVNLQQLRELRAGHNAIWFEHLLVTHLHSDHFNEATARFCKESEITVHVDPDAVRELKSRAPQSPTAAKLSSALEELDDAGLLSAFPPGTTKQIGSWIVHSTAALHDVPTNSYSMSFGSLSAFHSGDTGAYTPMMRSLAERAHVMLGDANYDIGLIDGVARDPAINERTKGPLGHMGNHQNADILRAVSRGAHSGNLQAVILLHRSDRSNKRNFQEVTGALKESWDAKSAGRHAPAIRMAERGPRVLCALTESRTLILPHHSSPDGFLTVQFGETGLSDLLGRDVMPELTRELHTRAAALDRLVTAEDLRERSRDENATIRWRVPSQIALAQTSTPERTKGIAPVVISRETTSGIVRININGEELGTELSREQLCRTLSKILKPRHPECKGKLFYVDHTNTLVSTVGLLPSLLEDVAKITELSLYRGVSRGNEKSEETRVRWSIGGKLALVMTDDVLFERAGLAELVALYNRDRQRLYIDAFGSRATKEYLDTDRVTTLINKLDGFIADLPSDQKKGNIAWSLRTSSDGRGTLKHTGELRLTKENMFSIRELIEQNLIWG